MEVAQQRENRPEARAVLEIRPAHLDDAPTIASIYNESLTQAPCLPPGYSLELAQREWAEKLRLAESGRPLGANYFGPITAMMARQWVVAHADAKRPMWVATHEGEAIAWLSLIGFSDRPAASGVHEVTCYVRPAHHRKGAALQLVNHAIEHSPAAGGEVLLATVWHDNTGSIGVLNRLRFERWGCIPKAVNAWGVPRDLLFYGMELSAGTAPG